LFTGKDLRNIGSGNLGGTNAGRAGESKGQKYLIYFSTGIIDLIKGAIPVIISILILKTSYSPWSKELIYTINAVLAIIGHDTMPFIKNGRGKGVATTAGAFLPIAAVPIMIGIVTFIVLRLFTSTASKRSIASFIVAAILIVTMNYPLPVKFGLVFASILIIITHRRNIARIIDGKE
jgi:acyl phosphate:glycerol-3-phosphate acyltransferase